MRKLYLFIGSQLLKKVNSMGRFMILLAVLLVATTSFAQQRRVTGSVADEQGKPIAGVTVMVKGTTVGVSTNAQGAYSINVPAGRTTLDFEYMGYASQSTEIGSRSVIDVVMVEEALGIEDVVVVGYGVQRRTDVTGALASVSEAQLKQRPVVNVFEALQGKAAGVDITTSSRPGEIGKIRIRGERSITAENSPLYVVDGIPLMSRSGIETINTNDIKSIEVLKDASATAIYGSRGANGVVLVTTNKGEAGRFAINYAGAVTIETIKDSREHFDSGEWMDFRRWAYYYSNPATYPRGDQPTQANDKSLFGNDAYAWRNVEKGWAGGTWNPSNVETTDWTQFVSQTGVSQNHTLSVSGGTEKVKTYISFGYLKQTGTTKGQEYQRYNFSSNTSVNPKKWFEMGAIVNASYGIQQYGQDGTGAPSSSGAGTAYESAMRLYPFAVPYDDEGNRITNPGGDPSVRTVVDEDKYSFNERKVLRLFGSLYAQVKIMDGLSYRFNFGPDFRYRRNGLFVSPLSAIRENPQSLVTLANQQDFSWTLDNLIFYNKSFGKHTVGATLLQTASKWMQTADNINGKNLPLNMALWNNMGSIDRANDITGVGSDLTERQLSSYMVRANYSYNDRYLLTASGRWDGASQLAPGHKWAFFPSLAMAWRIDQEEFMKTTDWVEQLKLRVGYGVTGNSAVDPYATAGQINSSLFPFGAATYRYYYVNDLLATSTRYDMPNLGLGWEKTGQWNVGVDFSLLNSRISGSLEAYYSHTKDLLLSASVPSMTGYVKTLANLGETANRGIEISLNTINLKYRDFMWESNLNVAYQKNEILKLANGKEDAPADNRFIGAPIGVAYDYDNRGLWRPGDEAEMAKYNSATNPDGTPKTAHNFKLGQVRPYDQNGDYVINVNDDRVILGSTQPKWTGGFINTFSYKGIEASINMYGRLGYIIEAGVPSTGARYMTRKHDYYTENNTTAKYSRPDYIADGSNRDSYSNLLTYEDGSFIYIRNISLGYVIPHKYLKRIDVSNFKIYAQVVNPGAIYSATKFRNQDVGGFVWNRSWVIGINLSF